MSNRKNTKRALFSSVMSLILCISMLLGSTYAWFTDTATTGVNIIQAGELKVDLVDKNDDTLVGKSLAFQKATDGAGEEILWEPGVTYETQIFYVKNLGNLALKYKLAINGLDGDAKLLDAIDFYLADENGNEYSLSTERNLAPEAKSGALKLVGKMKTTAGNEYQNLKLDGISVTVYATQASGEGAESDSYGNLYDQLADYAIFATKTKTLAAGASSVDFVMSYEGLTIANISVPASAIADTSKPVTVTIDAIEPGETITVGTNTKAYAYDIDVTNLKDNLTAEQEVSVVLTAPNALPAANVYHNGVLIGDATYEEVKGSISFKTDSFSPFAVSYLEYEASTIDELREYTAIDNAYVKLTADIEAQLNKEIDGNVCDSAHSHGSSSFSNSEGRCYFLVKIGGVNVTIDLNGHTIATYDSLNGESGKEWCGGTFYISSGASLNITDTAGGGKVKAMGPHYIVWANYWSDEAWCDIYGGIFMSDSYVGDQLGYGYQYNCAMIYSGYDDSSIGCINVYGGYYLYNNFNNNANIGSFNVGDSATTIGITVHDGVMLINKWYRQRTGTDDDAIALADGCEISEVTLDTPVVIDGVEYATWYQVQTTKPTFKTVFENTDTYLYRVGNSNTIKLGSLFQATNPNSVVAANATIDVKIESMDSATSVAGTYTAASTAANWANGTIKFTGTGPAKITINGCELLVEVVDGKNVTAATEIGSSSNVLLNDIALSSSKTSIGVGSNTLYGNGFTIDFAGYGKHSANTYGVITVSGGTIDNVKIIGDTYTTFTDTSTAEWYAAAVYATGTSKITNSYIHGCQAALRVQGTSCTVENTTLSGGRYANLQLKQGTLTLKDVTTVQEKVVVNGTTYLGFGINVWESATAGTSIKIKGDLTQYNWVTANDKSYLPGTAANYVDTAFGYDQFVYTHGGTKYVNLGIISISSNVMSSAIEVPTGYSAQDVGTQACVVTNNSTIDGTLLDNGVPTYAGWSANAHGVYAPTFTSAYPSQYDSNQGAILLSYEQGGSVTLSNLASFWNATKHGQTLSETVSVSGGSLSGDSVTFSAEGTYTITYTYTDPYNYDYAGNRNGSYTYTKTVKVIVNEIIPAIPDPSFTFYYKTEDITSTEQSLTEVSSKIVTGTSGAKYAMPDVSATVADQIGSTTVDGVTVYYPIVNAYWSGASLGDNLYRYYPIYTGVNFTIYSSATDTTGTTYNGDSTSTPDSWKWVEGGYNGGMGWSGYGNNESYGGYYRQSNAQSYKNNISKSGTTPVKFSIEVNGTYYYYYIGYTYSQGVEKIATSSGGGSCVTPDTLITLADGTQKRVDQLTGEEQLLVWNLETGKYDFAPIVFVDSEEETECEIIHLYFSNGSDVKVISEHGFFDLDLGKYVYVDATNYNDYVGHRFVTQGDVNSNDWNVVTLDKVVLETEVTTAWSPVTFEHLCYYTNGVLSMPGGIDGLFNIFEVDTDTMTYDAEQMQKDIETYGLFTYEDFAGLIPEIAFEAFNGDYLKVAISKGLLTWEDIAYLAERYMPLM